MVDRNPPSRPGERAHDVTSPQRALAGFEADPSARADDQDSCHGIVARRLAPNCHLGRLATASNRASMRTLWERPCPGSTAGLLDHGNRIALETRRVAWRNRARPAISVPGYKPLGGHH